jgi:hypothetical protein
LGAICVNDENGFKDKQDWYICFFLVPKGYYGSIGL